MILDDSFISYFDKNVLKLDPEKKKEYLTQVDYLTEQIQKKIDGKSVFNVRGSRKTGSLAKGTVLRPRGDARIDADVVLYLDVSEAESHDMELLHHIIRELLVSIYPSKKDEDFKVQPKTCGIHFHVSGLDVDLVPVIPIPAEPGYGWQPSSDGGDPIKTNVKGQLDFIRNRSQADPRFKSLVRLAKKWRNYQELWQLKSFVIELILAHIIDTDGPSTSLEEGMSRFFLYIAQSGLKDYIGFAENGPERPNHSHPVIILDPVNPDNNVTARLTEDERREIVNKAQTAWETLMTATFKSGKIETLELWKELFSRSFAIED